MDKWVIFGFSNSLSDIFDIIHARQGVVKAIVNNITPTGEEQDMLARRISLLGYPVPVVNLPDFSPDPEDHYCFGFLRGRADYLESLKNTHGIVFSTLIHPTAIFGSHVRLGEGVIVAPQVVLAPNSTIGDFCFINRAASVGHDSSIGDSCFIGPGVSVAGLVTVGQRTFIGIGSTIIDSVTIGARSVIGAGSVVIADIPDDVIAVGVPAKVIKQHGGSYYT